MSAKNLKTIINIHTKESELLYLNLIGMTPVPILILIKDQIVYANPKALVFFGSKVKKKIVGQSILSFIHPESRDTLQKRINLRLNSKKSSFVDEKYIDLKGKIHIAEVKTVNIRFKFEEAILTILQDVTDSRQIDRVLKQEEMRFRLFTENSSEGIVTLNPQGTILYASSSIKQINGYSPEELVGKNGFKMVSPKDMPLVTTTLSSLLLKPNTSARIQVRSKHKTGSWIWVDVVCKNLLQDKSVNALVVNFRDITKQKEGIERLQFLEKVGKILISSIDLDATLKNIIDIIVPYLADYCRIVLVDDNNQIREVATKHINPRKIALVEKLYSEYKSKKSMSYGINNILKTGKPEIISIVSDDIVRPSKENKGLASVIKKLTLRSYMGVPLEARGKTLGAVVFSSVKQGRIYTEDDLYFVQVVAQRIALALDNARLYSIQQQAVSHRDDFISLASHELKTPLTSLKLYMEIFQRKTNPDVKSLSIYKKMDDQIAKLTALVGDLLNVSKLQNGKLDFYKEQFDLSELVTETVDTLNAVSQSSTIIFQNSAKQKEVLADRYRIYQVLTNLLSNAVKYSGGNNKIIVRLTEQKNTLVVSVKDFGIGIDRQDQVQIFQQFFRVSKEEEKTYPGLGMGLYISSEIIKRHGGKMSVRSEKGKGSIFRFSLPLVDLKKN